MAKQPHPIDVHVGKRLRTLRNLRKMSQQDLGRQVGLTFQQIQKYERGSNRIAASRLYEFAEVLGACIMDFYEGLDGFYKDPNFPPFLTKEEISWLEIITALNNSEIERQLRGLMTAITQEGGTHE